jgi:hypothetical protein
MLEHEDGFAGGCAVERDDQVGEIVLQGGRRFFDDGFDDVEDGRQVFELGICDHGDERLNAVRP